MTPTASRRPPGARLGVRLTRTALAAAAVALLVAGSVLNGGMFWLARNALVADAQALAGVMSANLEAPLVFRDQIAAEETLQTLSASPQVGQATLLDSEGRRLAAYARDAGTAPPPRRSTLAGSRFEGSRLVVWEPVMQSGRRLGRVELVVSLQPLYRQTLVFGAITVAATLAALGLAWLLALGVRRDINSVEQRMDELAYVDAVTGLPNRHAAHEQLKSLTRRAHLGGAGFTLALLDLDDFKVINDTLGHPVGDQVLRALAARLLEVLPDGVQPYRFGGDEFLIVVEGDGAALPVRQALTALAAPLPVGGREIVVRCSVGTARFPGDAGDEDELLRAADAAMYHAKASGKDGHAAWQPQMHAASEQRLRVEAELRQAIAGGELRLHYQPIVELTSARIVGAEALVRWQHPQRGLLEPAEFIAAAEASGLVVELGDWVLAETAAQIRRWRAEGLDGFYVAVNASARQLRGGELLRQVERALAPGAVRLEIEITEHTLVEDAQHNVDTLRTLRERGIRVAIDDFGTGLSSLAYLRRLPVDKFKIDRSFVHELSAARGDLAIVRAVVSMARALDLQVTAEGVETAEQRDLLLALGCDHAQGWLFGRPLPPQAFAAALRAARGGAAYDAEPAHRAAAST